MPTNTDYKVGVKIIRDREPMELKPSEVTLNGLSAEEDLTNGYLTFAKSAGAEASMTAENLEVDYTPPTGEATNFLSSSGSRTKQETVYLILSGDNELIGKSVSMSQTNGQSCKDRLQPLFGQDKKISSGWTI